MACQKHAGFSSGRRLVSHDSNIRDGQDNDGWFFWPTPGGCANGRDSETGRCKKKPGRPRVPPDNGGFFIGRPTFVPTPPRRKKPVHRLRDNIRHGGLGNFYWSWGWIDLIWPCPFIDPETGDCSDTPPIESIQNPIGPSELINVPPWGGPGDGGGDGGNTLEIPPIFAGGANGSNAPEYDIIWYRNWPIIVGTGFFPAALLQHEIQNVHNAGGTIIQIIPGP